MLKSKFIISVVLSAICVVQSCKKEVFDTAVPVEVDPSLNCDNVNYENSAKSIFEAKCNTCHGATNQGPGDYNEVDILKRDLAKIRGRVESGTMPPVGSPQLTEVETSAMLLWIDCGASFEGTVIDTTVTQDTTSNQLVYETDIKSIISTKCAGCHPNGGGPGDYSITSNVKEVMDNGKFEDRVLIRKNMPTGGLPQNELDKIQKWFDQGAKFQ